jgi:hypothetical protein
MARRKPPGVSWDSWIDQSIREAQEQGQFDELPGAGKPLPDQGAGYDPDWWVKSLIERENLSILPPALAIRGKVERELRRIGMLRREADVRSALEALNEEIARTNRTVAEGPATGTAQIDIDRFVERWRGDQTTP